MTNPPGRRRLATAVAAVLLASLATTGPATAADAADSGGEPPAAAPATSARSLLASLGRQETEALHRMAALDLNGPHITDEAVLRSDEPVDVIVRLSTPPARTARLLAAGQGRELSEADAHGAVTKAHADFRTTLDRLFPATGAKAGARTEARVRRTYTRSFTGVSLSVPGDRIADLLEQDGVTAVWQDTAVRALSDPETGPAGAADIGGQDHDDGLARLHAEGVTGKGVKVGVIDTGIDHRHPDLKDAYAGGYDFVDDDTDPMETTYADWKASGQAETDRGSTYYTAHGTHVAGIVAGRGDTSTERAAHGVAPGASVHAYRVLGPYGTGRTSDIIAAMDRAAEDGMDVVNMSLGAAINDPLSPQAVAADNLVLAGVTTVIAAGNSGPSEGTLGTPGAAALPITVGAHAAPLTLPAYTLAAGPVRVGGRLLAQSFGDALDALTRGDGLGVTDVGTGTAAGYTGKDVTGRAVLVTRGGTSLDDKVRRARSMGAAAVLLVNDKADEGHIPAYLGEKPSYVPAFSLTAADGAALAAAAVQGEVSFTAAGTFRLGDGSLAEFSSRGPVYGTSAIKPEVTAPGVSVLSSVPADAVDPAGGDHTTAYARMSGTSMAAPYVAGAAALLLQHDPGMGPDDVKTALMNTAVPLPGNPSVFEAGAGAVDPYAAVHARTTLQVPARTASTGLDGTPTEIEHRTGALDLGVLPPGRATTRAARMELVNTAGAPGTYRVSAAFTRGSGASQDARAAGVTLTTDDRVTVGARGKVPVRTTLHVPAGAPVGHYEGFLVLTPLTAGASGTLRVPFGLRVAPSGFEEVVMTKPVMSTGRATAEGAVGGGAATFDLRMAGELRSIDVFLTDERGVDIGYVGGVNTTGLTEGVLYGPATVGAWYYPLTGDEGTPVDPRGRWMEDGAHQLRIVGTDAFGGTDSELRRVYVDNAAPRYEDSYGAWDPAHPQVVERAPTASSFELNGTLRDGEADAIRSSGLDIGQDDNVLYYSLYSPNAPTGHVAATEDGTVRGSVAIQPVVPVALVKLWPADAAGNIGATRVLNVVKEGTPYVVGDASAATARAGDRVTYTLTAHELRRLRTFTSQIRYDDRNIRLVGVEPTPELAAHAPSVVRRSDVSAGASSYSTVTVDVGDAEGITDDSMPLLKVTYEVTGGWQTASAGLATGTTTVVDTEGVRTMLNIQFYGAVRMLAPTSSFGARPAVQGLLTEAGAYDAARDHSADDIAAALTAPDGTVTALTADRTGRMSVSGLAPSDGTHRFDVRVPGHFGWSEEIDLALRGPWGLAGTGASSRAALLAGDVNGDDVIDVRDAAAVHAARGTGLRAADIDHDGVVDAADMAWVVTNYLRQNSMSERYTDPVKRLRGRTLEDYVALM
ncbi:S8 family serine peptidase [Streptomyces omiyaensis]|uniref:S8 family serine peptidase n=1 Tax=Streptomyces omiyaensis TaxID=68247 RepID=A0ABW7BQK1_9ACTN